MLSAIQDPDLGRDVVSLGMIKDLVIGGDGRVSFTFELTTPACPVRDRFQTMATKLVADLPGVTAVDLKMTANVRSAFNRPQPNQVIPGVRDIYGPSIPGMLGVQDTPRVVDQKLIPLEAFGVKLMSIGFLAGADKAMVWRGPMVSRAIEQMLTDVRRGELDYLVIDLPPGTGDASLTLAQAVALTGVAIVCTPQTAALNIAVKALQMFRGLNVNPLGLVENMSWFVCGRCSEEHFIFDHGGAERAAKRLGVPYLGGIPLEKSIREEADAGAPVVVSRPDTAGAKAFRDVASAVAARISVQSFRQLPVINVR